MMLAFLKEEGTTSRAARFMNQNGFELKKQVYGGGQTKPRLGHFTFQNTYDILMNPIYIGIKRFKNNGETKEAKGCWDAIIDPLAFERTQKLLKANISRKRPDYPKRFPFLLSGLVKCSECGISMIGKTANGNGGKVGYYDHGVSQKRYQCTDQKPAKCSHVRVQSVALEGTV